MKTLLLSLTLLFAPAFALGAELRISWKDNASNELAQELERSSDAGETFETLVVLGPDVETYTDATVETGVEYCYRVRAANNFGYSAYSNVDCELSDGPPPPPSDVGVAPPKPMLEIITNSDGSLTIRVVEQ